MILQKTLLTGFFFTSAILTAQGPPGWNPISWYPAMGFGSSPASQSLVSGAQFTQLGTVSDKDTYQRSTTPNDFAELINSAIDVTATIRSGSVLSINLNYNAATGVLTKTWVIRAREVPADTSMDYIDSFRGIDNGNVMTVKDEDTPISNNIVTVNGPKSPPGGGG